VSKDTKKSQSNCTQVKKPQPKVCTGIEKTPVQRHKKNPSPQVKRYTEESRLKGAKATLMQLKLYKPPPLPLH